MMKRVLAAITIAGALAAAPDRAFAQTGWGIGVLKTGDVYFCDRTRDRVWRLSADGALTGARSPSREAASIESQGTGPVTA